VNPAQARLFIAPLGYGVSYTPYRVDNGDIDFFICRHRFRITRPKFPKFKGDQTAAEKI
jgi:hypothetical protein